MQTVLVQFRVLPKVLAFSESFVLERLADDAENPPVRYPLLRVIGIFARAHGAAPSLCRLCEPVLP